MNWTNRDTFSMKELESVHITGTSVFTCRATIFKNNIICIYPANYIVINNFVLKYEHSSYIALAPQSLDIQSYNYTIIIPTPFKLFSKICYLQNRINSLLACLF